MPKLLVVDDSELDRRFAAGLLEGSAYDVTFAENGARALELIEKQPPDLILTDLQMPELDGLELVTSSRLQAPHVPIVLMTAHGGEAIAAEALQRGAASYVPKAELGEKLLATLDEIAALQKADRSYRRLVECSTHTEFDFVLPNDPTLIDPLVDLAQQMLHSLGICDSNGELQIGVALEQAIQNAMIRGNLELTREACEAAADFEALVRDRQGQAAYAGRTVYVRMRMDRDEAHFDIRDQGDGFDHEAAQQNARAGEHSGRGLVLINAFMDEVEYHGNGNSMHMVKRRAK